MDLEEFSCYASGSPQIFPTESISLVADTHFPHHIPLQDIRMPQAAGSARRKVHNPYQLPCIFVGCRQWFRNQSGLTQHIRSQHRHDRQAPTRQAEAAAAARVPREGLTSIHPHSPSPPSSPSQGGDISPGQTPSCSSPLYNPDPTVNFGINNIEINNNDISQIQE